MRLTLLFLVQSLTHILKNFQIRDAHFFISTRYFSKAGIPKHWSAEIQREFRNSREGIV